MSIESVKAFINQHNASGAALAALTAALDALATGAPLDPTLASRIQDVLVASGGGNALDDLGTQEAAALVAELRNLLLIESRLLHAHTRSMVWNPSEREILQAGGDFARAHAHALTRNVIPMLDGLADAVRASGAAFLDIGVGVAGLAIAMAHMWPELRVVGIDPWQPALRLAQENVEKANLGSRIELREQGVEMLEDRSAFDLAWLPIPFIPERAIAEGCGRALRALRPGGWMVVAMGNHAAMDPTAAAVFRLRLTLCGGPLWSPGDVERVMREQGFVDARTLPGPPGALVAIVVGRRQPE